MRITTNQTLRSQLASLQANGAAMLRAQETVSTQLRVRTISDDPAAGGTIMANSSALRAIGQYRRNVQQAQSRAGIEDQSLAQATNLLDRARELAIQGGSDTTTAAQRLSMGAEVEEILRSLGAIANTAVDGEYFFGGDRGTEQPFTITSGPGGIDFTTTGAAGMRRVEVGHQQTITPTHDGKTAFIDTGVLAAVRDLARAFTNPTGNQRDQINGAQVSVQGAFAQLQGVIGDLGARANTLELTSANLDAFESSLKVFQSDLRDADLESALTELVSKQTSYQAAMLASQKVLSLNLTDYLR
ncbi:MAG: flagellar hook-associated protein FlgL [Gemmatimonadaceae bacterium]